MALGALLSRLDDREEVRGRQFERIVQWFLRAAPEYRPLFKDIWLWEDWPAFLYGSGANGKSVFRGALRDVLGDYAMEAAPELLVAKDRHATDIADLQGRRLVTTIEVDDGQRLAEGLVKRVTGERELKARYMRQDNFTFTNTATLWLAASPLRPAYGVKGSMSGKMTGDQSSPPPTATFPPGRRTRRTNRGGLRVAVQVLLMV